MPMTPPSCGPWRGGGRSEASALPSIRRKASQSSRPQAAAKRAARCPPRGMAQATLACVCGAIHLVAAVAYAANMPPACLLTLRRGRKHFSERKRTNRPPLAAGSCVCALPLTRRKRRSLFRQKLTLRFPQSSSAFVGRSPRALREKCFLPGACPCKKRISFCVFGRKHKLSFLTSH